MPVQPPPPKKESPLDKAKKSLDKTILQVDCCESNDCKNDDDGLVASTDAPAEARGANSEGSLLDKKNRKTKKKKKKKKSKSSKGDL